MKTSKLETSAGSVLMSILKGVTIGEGAIIGAGSVVTSDVKAWHIGAGNPFRHIRSIEENRDE